MIFNDLNLNFPLEYSLYNPIPVPIFSISVVTGGFTHEGIPDTTVNT